MTALTPVPRTADPAAGRAPDRAHPAVAALRVTAAAGVALAAAAGAAATYLAFVRTTVGQTVDEAAMQGATVPHDRLVLVLSRTLTGTSLGYLLLASLVAAAIGLLRRRIDLAVAAGVLVLGANFTTQALKARLDRPLLTEPAPNSWPSGHTTAAVSVAMALVLVLPYAARAAAALAGAGYVSVIAIATVWAGWHRPSDTVAGLLISLAWGSAAVAVVRTARPGRPPERAASRLATVPLAAGAVAATSAALAALGALVLTGGVLPGVSHDTAAFLAGSAGIAGAAAATFLVWVRLVADQPPARA